MVEGGDNKKCPEIMKATQACYCMDCPKAKEGTCSIEKMAREAGCVHGFPTYCTYRDQMRTNPQYGLCDVMLKEWYQKLRAKFDVQLDDSAKPMVTLKEIKDEVTHAKEEGKGTKTAEPSGGIECPEKSL
jgi:hypothetical protein